MYIPINITVLDWLIYPRILFVNIHAISTLRAFAQSYFLAHCFGTERDLACIFATLSSRWDYKKGGGGVVNRGIRSSVGGSDRGALSAYTPAEISPGWFIHINVSHCTSPYTNCARGNKTAGNHDRAL